MNILAFDTSQKTCTVCIRVVSGGNTTNVERVEPLGTGHAERLMPMIAEAMKAAELSFSDIDRIAVTTGPGSFTGVRIAIAAARGFALAGGIPTVSMTTHEVLVVQARAGSILPEHGICIVVDDARREQLYMSAYGTDGVCIVEPVAVHTSDALNLLPADVPLFAVGSGAALLKQEADRRGRTIEILMEEIIVDCRILADLATQKPIDQRPPVPLYLRAPDAKPQAGHVLARQPSTTSPRKEAAR